LRLSLLGTVVPSGVVRWGLAFEAPHEPFEGHAERLAKPPDFKEVQSEFPGLRLADVGLRAVEHPRQILLPEASLLPDGSQET